MATSSNIYQVDKIVDYKVDDGKELFKVHWSGYSQAHDTWEPLENLSNCLPLVEEFLDKRAAVERRKSLRSNDHYTLSSDEDSKAPSPKKKPKKAKVSKRTTRSSVTPQPTNTSTVSTVVIKTNYSDFSTDEELTSGSTRTTRLSLSENKFKKRLGDISHSSVKTSTPSKSPQANTTTTTTKIRSSKRLTFDSQNTGGMLTRHKQREIEEAGFIAEAPPSIIAQAEEPTEGSGDVESEQPADVGIESEQDVCFPVTWREFALAGFLTGIAAIGYVCYTTDYC